MQPIDICMSKVKQLLALSFFDNKDSIKLFQNRFCGLVCKFPLNTIRAVFSRGFPVVKTSSKPGYDKFYRGEFSIGGSQVTTKAQRTSFFENFTRNGKSAFSINKTSQIMVINGFRFNGIKFLFDRIKQSRCNFKRVSFSFCKRANFFFLKFIPFKKTFYHLKLRKLFNQKSFKRFMVGRVSLPI